MDSAVLLCQGAEARVYLTNFIGLKAIAKERLSKSYRLKELDNKINKQRILQECRSMLKCRKSGVKTPSIFLVDVARNRLFMEYISGCTAKQFLQAHFTEKDICLEVAKKIGVIVGKMHEADVVHGDLTTSNMIVSENSEVTLIDFGLATMKPTVEDKAVDLYVLERAFDSTHPGSQDLVSQVLESYRFACHRGTPVLLKLEQVRMRGRKRDMIG